MKELITEAQQQALERAYAILGEHFDAALIVVCWERDDRSDAFRLIYKGGFASALGLSVYATHRLTHDGKLDNPTEEE